jgi:flagellar FliL protein
MSSEEEKAPPAPAAAKPPSQMKLIIVGAVALFVALVGAQVAVPLINGMIAAAAHSGAADAEEGAEAVADEEGAAEDAIENENENEQPTGPALYAALDPPFVVSFDEEDGARFLQLTLQAMARDEKTIAAIKLHAPAIRNSVLHKLSGYELPVLNTQAGKEQLRKDLFAATNEILAKNQVEHGIEELYFTSLVVQ